MSYKLEREIERQATKHVESLGGKCLKVQLAYGRGYPDREILLPHGLTIRTEFKKPGGVVSHHQKRWIQDLLDLGHPAGTVDDIDDFKRSVDIAIAAHEFVRGVK